MVHETSHDVRAIVIQIGAIYVLEVGEVNSCTVFTVCL